MILATFANEVNRQIINITNLVIACWSQPHTHTHTHKKKIKQKGKLSSNRC